MANKPYDQRVINPLERPTSSDLNIAQSQLNANMAFLLGTLTATADWGSSGALNGKGSLNRSFYVTPAGGMELNMNWGLGIGQGTRNDSNIGGILGLNDINDVNYVYSSARTLALGNSITVPAGPGLGFYRKDMICIRPPQLTEGLADSIDTDIYNPSTNAFRSEARWKTFTRDLASFPVAYMNWGDPVPTNAPIVYFKGPVAPYANPEDLEVAPSAGLSGTAGWINVATINVVGSPTAITESDIIDWRRLISPSGTLTIQGSAVIGTDPSGNIGNVLSDVKISTPAGLKVCLSKIGGNTTNYYALFVFGARACVDASIAFSTQQPLGTGLFDPPSSRALRVSVIGKFMNQLTTADYASYVANASFTSPAIITAIGQPLHLFTFALEQLNVATSGEPDSPYVIGNPARISLGTNADGSTYRTIPVTFAVTLRLE